MLVQVRFAPHILIDTQLTPRTYTHQTPNDAKTYKVCKNIWRFSLVKIIGGFLDFQGKNLRNKDHTMGFLFFVVKIIVGNRKLF